MVGRGEGGVDSGHDASFNGASLDGCPFISRDGKSFFMASRRLTGPGDAKRDTTGPVLYFSSTITGTGDLYLSESHGGAFQGRQLVPGVNTASTEGQPNVRSDGLELFFFSNRPGSLGNDIYSASRASTADDWSTPVNLGPAVNGTTASSETRPSLSWDGTTLY